MKALAKRLQALGYALTGGMGGYRITHPDKPTAYLSNLAAVRRFVEDLEAQAGEQ